MIGPYRDPPRLWLLRFPSGGAAALAFLEEALADANRTLANLDQLVLLDPVLPLPALASMSAVTVAIIVLVVTTVADAGLHLQDTSGAGFDPWSAAHSSPVAMYYQDGAGYLGSDVPMETLERESSWLGSPADSLSVARGAPNE